jgi:hypothetical protein
LRCSCPGRTLCRIEKAKSRKEEKTNRKDNKDEENLKRKNNIFKKLTVNEFR